MRSFRLDILPRLLFVAAMLCLGRTAYATEQYPDYIEYGGKKYELAVSWGYPSPLQVLYIRTNTQSPFKGWSTANYRGHIATWRVSDGKLYLVNVDTRRHRGRTGTSLPDSDKRLDTLAAPGYFGIASLAARPPEADGAVLADWFSGVLTLSDTVAEKGKKQSKAEGTRYIYVRYGEVVDDQLVQANDFKRMQNVSYRDTSDHKFIAKYLLAYMNQCYLSFYFQSGGSKDRVMYDRHEGRLASSDFRPPLMSLFDYDPLNFWFNWENLQRNGAPVCRWSISHDSLFINSITLWSGLGFFEHDEDTVDLDSIFQPELIVNGKVFAYWMNGEQNIEYGEECEGDFGIKEFRMERQQNIVLDSGRIVKSVWTPSDFNAAPQAALADCDPQHVYRCAICDTKDRYNELPKVAAEPYWTDGNEALQAWFDNHPLTDPRAKDMILRTVLGFKVNCRGEAGEWYIASKGRGVLFELSNQVLEISKQLPDGWIPATDADGNAVDCWQVLQFNIKEGRLKCTVYKKKNP